MPARGSIAGEKKKKEKINPRTHGHTHEPILQQQQYVVQQ